MASPTLTEPTPAAPETPVPVAAPPAGRGLTLACAAVSGVLLYLSYFPVSCGWLAWFALVPLLGLVRTRRRARVLYPCLLVAGWACYTGALYWMSVADPRMAFAWIFLAFYCALYWLFAVRLLRFLDRRTRLPLVVTVPVVWVALEYFRSSLGPGFSWYQLGYTQHDFLPVIQIADTTGVYGVSFLIAAVNALLAEWLLARAGWFRRLVGAPADMPAPSRFALLVRGVAVFVLLMGTLAYGGWRLGQNARAPGPRIALIQGNLDQRLRNQGGDPNDPDRLSAVHTTYAHFSSLCALSGAYGPRLIVWSETSYPGEWEDVAPDVPPERVPAEWRQHHEDAVDFARRFSGGWSNQAHYFGHAPPDVLLGVNSVFLEPDGVRRYNSAFLLDPDGQVLGRYDKIHRVPLGEYIPWRDWVPFLNYLAPYDFDYSIAEGRSHTRFPLGGHTFGVVICYEDTIPYVNRPYGGGDGRPPADFVLNISNDGWFDGSSEHQEHLAICRFRAVENRRPYARAVNMGISAVIDGNGRVLRPREHDLPPGYRPPDPKHLPKVWEVTPDADELPVSEWGRYKKVSGVLLATVPLDGRRALYPVLGDWLPQVCWAVLGLCVAGVVWRRFRGPPRS
jgi:apolipoprotein N-acyltransferase